MQGKLVTVFGGSGFLGRYVVQKLAKTGAFIRVATRNTEEALSLKPYGFVGQIIPISVDVTSEESVSRAISGSDAVINLIGILNETKRKKFTDLHIKVPGLIAKLCRLNNVKHLVHVSAIGASLKSSSKYAQSKAEGERKVFENFPRASIIKPSIIFGEEDTFFNRFATMLRYFWIVPMFGGGKCKLQPVYVCDVAEAIVKAALSDHEYDGSTYELGGPRIYTLRQLLEYICTETSRNCWFIPLPYWTGSILGLIFEHLPGKFITSDQVKLIRADNIVSKGSNDFSKFNIQPSALECIVPRYISRYRYIG